jgi:hypothetical protein
MTARKFIPSLGQRLSAKTGAWEAWLYLSTTGKQCMVFYRGAFTKPCCHFNFKSRAAALQSLTVYAADAEAALAEKQARTAARKAALSKGHDLAVGDVLYNSWGYDQTNVDFFQVTAVIGKRMVEVRQLASQAAGTGRDSGQCVPKPDQFTGEPMRKMVDAHNHVNVLNASFGRASKLEYTEIAGVRLYAPKSFSTYA